MGSDRMGSDRAFIFQMCIPWGKTISLVSRSMSRSHFSKNACYGGISISQTLLIVTFYHTDLSSTSNLDCFENDMGKGVIEMLVTKLFSFSHNVSAHKASSEI